MIQSLKKKENSGARLQDLFSSLPKVNGVPLEQKIAKFEKNKNFNNRDERKEDYMDIETPNQKDFNDVNLFFKI